MYIKQDIDKVKGFSENKGQDGKKHTTLCQFPISMSDQQQEFTDLNKVCDAVKKTEPSGVCFQEVNATWTKRMNFDTNMMDKVLEVRIVSDQMVTRSCVEDMMQKLEDHMQEQMKDYPEWNREVEGPKPYHACVHYEKEKDVEKPEDDFTAAVESIPKDDKGLEQ